MESPYDFFEDGLLHCWKCGAPKQARPNLNGREYIVPCLCDCEAASQRERERERKLLFNRVEHSGTLAAAKMMGATFERADKRNEAALIKAKLFCDMFGKVDSAKNGLCLTGKSGVGKTFISGCIANRLVNDGYKVDIVSAPQLISRAREFERGLVERFMRCDLLIVDDYGAEANTEFAVETMYRLVDGRYSRRAPMVVSTNLSEAELGFEHSLMNRRRINRRIVEVCELLKFPKSSMSRMTTGRCPSC